MNKYKVLTLTYLAQRLHIHICNKLISGNPLLLGKVAK